MDFPRRLEGLEYFTNEISGFAVEMSKLIDNAFKKAGLTIVPSMVRYVLCSVVICSPCVGLMMMICFGQDDEPSGSHVAPAHSHSHGG
tara:strand:+ start:181 stop:444 length:264 start_codon:yes stop_codon:yes gene_type:complete